MDAEPEFAVFLPVFEWFIFANSSLFLLGEQYVALIISVLFLLRLTLFGVERLTEREAHSSKFGNKIQRFQKGKIG